MNDRFPLAIVTSSARNCRKPFSCIENKPSLWLYKLLAHRRNHKWYAYDEGVLLMICYTLTSIADATYSALKQQERRKQRNIGYCRNNSLQSLLVQTGREKVIGRRQSASFILCSVSRNGKEDEGRDFSHRVCRSDRAVLEAGQRRCNQRLASY